MATTEVQFKTQMAEEAEIIGKIILIVIAAGFVPIVRAWGDYIFTRRRNLKLTRPTFWSYLTKKSFMRDDIAYERGSRDEAKPVAKRVQGTQGALRREEIRCPCPYCAEAILPKANRCPFCRSHLEQGWVHYSNEFINKFYRGKTKACPKCEKLVRADRRDCYLCGALLHEGAESSSQGSAGSKTNLPITWPYASNGDLNDSSGNKD